MPTIDPLGVNSLRRGSETRADEQHEWLRSEVHWGTRLIPFEIELPAGAHKVEVALDVATGIGKVFAR